MIALLNVFGPLEEDLLGSPLEGAPGAGAMRQSSDAAFEWRLFADATCAGLAVLIPLPLLDYLVECVFRRRIPGAIARLRGSEMDPLALAVLGRREPFFGWSGCLWFPFRVLYRLLKRLSRKILYVLTVRDAARALGAYWQRAYLIDHMLRSGQVAAGRDVAGALAAFERALRAVEPGGLRRVGRQLIDAGSHILRALRRARRRGAEGELREESAFLGTQWEVMRAELTKVVAAYEALLATRLPEDGGGARVRVE